jgi:uncharacterized delta-60 repeat protein
MRSARLGLAMAFIASVSVTTVSVANDGGPVRDLNWGAVAANNGIAYTSFDVGGTLSDAANVGALDQNGDLLLVGFATTSSSAADTALARITSAHGVLDAGFGSGGRERLGTTFNGGPRSIALQPEGKILYGELTSTTTFLIARLLADGTPDLTFNFNGQRGFAASAFLPLGTVLIDPMIIVQPSGKLVIVSAAGRTAPDVQEHVVAIRLNTDGSTDTTFGGSGTGIASYAPDNAGVPLAAYAAVRQLANGQLLVGGYAFHPGGSGTDVVVFKLSADGTLDTSFGTNGYAFVAFDQGGDLSDFLTDLAVDAQGRVVISANITDIQGRPRAALARFTAAGQIDTTFGVGGRVLYEIRDAAVWEYSASVAVLPDGRILVAGTSALCGCGGQQDAGTLTMFMPNGQVNPYFGASGTEHFGSFTGPDSQNFAIERMLVSGDYVYLIGKANNPVGSNNQDFGSARVVVSLFRSGFEEVVPAPE